MSHGLPEFVVRQAEPDDADRIAELYTQLTGNPGVRVLPARIASLGQDANARLFVCEYLGEVCGTALVALCADAMFGRQPFGVVENVVVDDALRGKGVGSLLLRHAEAFCLASDCSKMMLMSGRERDDAHRFFEAAGFTGAVKRAFVKYRRDMALRIDAQAEAEPV
ncbi:GNAT family N-acetyltransferase [Paludibacterium paludis]|uniref:N-acetyltransferase n=1 Tax=Paludibacterium paludis TaxID=1225769 RepID=A0A918P1T9_9NEIS|nr:GNAT family N-acetyltransferase [Paludibacterium paludis]GGY10604.1 N-acetyltransferase [Paludibacterium paludis]